MARPAPDDRRTPPPLSSLRSAAGLEVATAAVETPCETSSCGAVARRHPAGLGGGRERGRGGGRLRAETPRRELGEESRDEKRSREEEEEVEEGGKEEKKKRQAAITAKRKRRKGKGEKNEAPPLPPAKLSLQTHPCTLSPSPLPVCLPSTKKLISLTVLLPLSSSSLSSFSLPLLSSPSPPVREILVSEADVAPPSLLLSLILSL